MPASIEQYTALYQIAQQKAAYEQAKSEYDALSRRKRNITPIPLDPFPGVTASQVAELFTASYAEASPSVQILASGTNHNLIPPTDGPAGIDYRFDQFLKISGSEAVLQGVVSVSGVQKEFKEYDKGFGLVDSYTRDTDGFQNTKNREEAAVKVRKSRHTGDIQKLFYYNVDTECALADTLVNAALLPKPNLNKHLEEALKDAAKRKENRDKVNLFINEIVKSNSATPDISDIQSFVLSSLMGTKLCSSSASDIWKDKAVYGSLSEKDLKELSQELYTLTKNKCDKYLLNKTLTDDYRAFINEFGGAAYSLKEILDTNIKEVKRDGDGRKTPSVAAEIAKEASLEGFDKDDILSALRAAGFKEYSKHKFNLEAAVSHGIQQANEKIASEIGDAIKNSRNTDMTPGDLLASVHAGTIKMYEEKHGITEAESRAEQFKEKTRKKHKEKSKKKGARNVMDYPLAFFGGIANGHKASLDEMATDTVSVGLMTPTFLLKLAFSSLSSLYKHVNEGEVSGRAESLRRQSADKGVKLVATGAYCDIKKDRNGFFVTDKKGNEINKGQRYSGMTAPNEKGFIVFQVTHPNGEKREINFDFANVHFVGKPARRVEQLGEKQWALVQNLDGTFNYFNAKGEKFFRKGDFKSATSFKNGKAEVRFDNDVKARIFENRTAEILHVKNMKVKKDAAGERPKMKIQ